MSQLLPFGIHKPSQGYRLDPGNPLSKGLVWAYLFNEGGGKPQDLVKNRVGTLNGTISWTRQASGKCLEITSVATTNYVNLGLFPASWYSGQGECTIVCGYRKTDATARAAGVCADSYAGATQRLLFAAPWSDGITYWEFGNSTEGSGTLSVSGLTFGNDIWVTIASTKNGGRREIWQNGVLRGSNTGNAVFTPYSSSVYFELGGDASLGASSDLAQYTFFYVYNRALSPNEIQSISTNPYQIVQAPYEEWMPYPPVTLLPTGITSAEAFGTPLSQVQIHPTGIVSSEVFGTPGVIQQVSGEFHLESPVPTISGELELYNHGLITITAPIVEMSCEAILTNRGIITVISPMASIDISGGDKFAVVSPMSIFEGALLLTNRGTITATSPITIGNFIGTAPIYGTITAVSPMSTVLMQTRLTNRGAITVASPIAIFAINGLYTNWGAFTVDAPVPTIDIPATITVQGQIVAVAPMSYMNIIGISLSHTGVLTLVINTENFALSEYSNYAFNSFTHFNGKDIGCKSDGIYELAGNDDNGIGISALVRFPTVDLEENLAKRLKELIYTGRNSGILVFKVIENENTTGAYSYNTELATSTIHWERIKTGKGRRSRFVTVELSNFNGCDFDINSLRGLADPIPQKRR
jgi:hypothetical protein